MARVKDCIQPGANSDDAANAHKTVEDVNDAGRVIQGLLKFEK